MKIGVIPESYQLPLIEGIAKAAELGADGVQIYAIRRRLDVNHVTAPAAERSALKRSCLDRGMVFSAICADVGGHDFQIDGKNMERAELTCRIVDFAVEMESKVITSHIGCIPDDPADPVYPNMVAAVRRVADYAAGRGVTMAIETGPESAETLLAFIETVNSPGLGVNLDPANFKMVLGYDPVRAVELLGKYIVHTHAKDGVNLASGNPWKAYGMVNPDGSERQCAGVAPQYREVALGTGEVPWHAYLAKLKSIGYNGFLTIERECGDNPAADIRTAFEFLKKQI